MTHYRNGSVVSQWDVLGAKRGVPSIVSQAPIGQQASNPNRSGPGMLRGRMAAKNNTRDYAIAPSQTTTYEPSKVGQHRLGTPNAGPAVLGCNGAPTLASFQTGRQTMRTKFSTTSRAPTRMGGYVPRATFQPGVILRIPHHVPALPNSKIKTNALTNSSIGEICSKFRPFIVVSSNEETYQALALYTYGDSGTDGVMCKDEYISVRDHRDLAPFEKLSKYEPLVTGEMRKGVQPFNLNSVCHVVGIFTFSYFTQVQVEGKLSAESTARLARLKYAFDNQMLEQAVKA